jgi:hypothetical protein
MLSLAMTEVERMANDSLPAAAAHRRPLARAGGASPQMLVAAAIATGQPVHRSPFAPPAAVLGVRIEAKATRAA